MTIYVQTAYYGELEFDADDWDIKDGESLWVGTDGVGVAQFAKGSWLFVYEEKTPEPEQAPVNFSEGDRAVITGPVVFMGDEPFGELEIGQVVVIEDSVDEDGDVFVQDASGRGWYIAQSSLSAVGGDE